jgi:periplasmic divalent cation tolerance protein
MKFVYTTVKNEGEAAVLANNAIHAHLVACADFWPIRSLYMWEGYVEDIVQYMVVFTTDDRQVEDLTSLIKKLHSYKVPLVGVSDVHINNVDYQLWAKNYLYGEKDLPVQG